MIKIAFLETPVTPDGQSQSPVAPIIAQWGREKSVYGGRDGGYTQTQQHGFPLTKVSLATALLNGQSANSRGQP